MRDVKDILARWQIRFEFANRIMNLVFGVTWLAMFCKIFEMGLTGYIITGITAVVLFVGASWFLDKSKMIDHTQTAIWQKTPEYHKMNKLLEEIHARICDNPDL